MNTTQAAIEAKLAASSPKLTPLRILVLAVVAFIYWGAITGTEISIKDIVTGFPAIGELLVQMFPPDWKYMNDLWKPVVETLQIGIIATFWASLLALPLAFLAAKNVSPHPVVYLPVRFFLTICRGVSEIIWALLFVVAVGLGPFAGVIALIIYCVGVIGKLLAEAVEAVDPGPLEAMTAAGASRWRVFLYGAWPQVLPLYLSYCLYYWDHNTRQSIVLGFVGAGGVGYALFFNLSTYYFEKAMMAMIVLIFLIVAIDRFCLYLRQKII
ncbi:MAG: phosphonate ABC transporter, permease protein PhnE [Rhodospirillaceae bacterium]